MEARGIRNNNPLNIRKGNNWKGERSPQSDLSFEEFTSMAYGLRAAFVLLRNYVTGYGGRSPRFDTIEKIVRRWAPPSENATQRYIDTVASYTGINPRQQILFSDRKSICAIARAMAFVECGQWIPPEQFESAYDLI